MLVYFPFEIWSEALTRNFLIMRCLSPECTLDTESLVKTEEWFFASNSDTTSIQAGMSFSWWFVSQVVSRPSRPIPIRRKTSEHWAPWQVCLFITIQISWCPTVSTFDIHIRFHLYVKPLISTHCIVSPAIWWGKVTENQAPMFSPTLGRLASTTSGRH